MNKSNSKPFITTKDFLVSGESFDLMFNQDKTMLSTHPQPQAEVLGKYYESTEYISHTDNKKGMLPFLYQSVKKYSLQKKVGLIRNLNKDVGSLLDIGAGTGEFCKEAQKNGWLVKGVEPNNLARGYSEAKGILLHNNIDQVLDQQFDVVTLWHVLEHLPDLDEQVGKISSLVKPGGVLIIAVPNFKSYDAKHYKKFWAAYDVPRHLWHFSRQSIEILFSANFTLAKTKPMLFDSFYVSLLSEKYKTGNTFSVKAFFVGLWSNMHAWKTNEYSSHIYCFKKQF